MKKNSNKYEFAGPFKMIKTCPNGPKVIFFAHKNILFGIFSPGVVPRISALCSLWNCLFRRRGGIDVRCWLLYIFFYISWVNCEKMSTIFKHDHVRDKKTFTVLVNVLFMLEALISLRNLIMRIYGRKCLYRTLTWST